MDLLIQSMKERIEKSTKKGESVNIGELMEDFISEGYTKEQVTSAFYAVLKMHCNDEYD